LNPLPERLNERLEREERRSRRGGAPSDWLASSTHAPGRDPEVDELVALARRLQATPHLQADPLFAQHLERRLLLLQTTVQHPARKKMFIHLWGAHPALRFAFVLCLCLLLVGTSMLEAAAQVSNPENPLYALKRWEQGIQISLPRSPETQAESDLQSARDRLNTLATLASPAHAEAYRYALADFEQQLSTAASAIEVLPAKPDRARLRKELATLEADARQTLRGFLLQLAVPERLSTTDALGRLGDTIPHLLSVQIILPAQPNGRASINIAGDNVQQGAQLLVNNLVIGGQGSFPNGTYVFTIPWSGDEHPQSIGILNPDGTAAQTTAITLPGANGNGNGNGGNTQGGHGNGNHGKKPTATPTPHHPGPASSQGSAIIVLSRPLVIASALPHRRFPQQEASLAVNATHTHGSEP
jgi:hypothetical protein